MARYRSRQIATAWLACFAMLLAALSPVIANVLASWDAPSAVLLSEICFGSSSDTGAPALTGQVTPVNASLQPRNKQHDGAHFGHCPFCTHGGMSSLLPTKYVLPSFSSQGVLVCLLFLISSQPLFSWLAAQPRSPPA